jgi:subtilisin family serine protease
MKHLFTITFLSLLFFLQVDMISQNQSKIHPYLQVKLLEASNNEMLNVYATLKEQYPLDAARQQTYSLPRKDRQKEVVRILREFAETKQQAVRQFLNNAKQQNRVSRIDILWAANTIVFTAVPEVIYSLAENFDEIAEIRYEAQIDENMLIDITEPSVPVPSFGESDNPVPQPGLTLINAPAVWAEGDSGQGVIAANHDSGCDWDHPDLVKNIWNNLGEDFDNDGRTIEWNGSSWVFDPGDVNGVDDDANGYVDDFIGWDFLGNDNNPGPSGTHGTNTAGIICGDGTNGTQTGVAPKAKLINCKLSGEATAWLAVQYSVAAGVDVITSSHSYKWYFSPKPNYPMHRQMNDFVLTSGVVQTNSTSNDGNNLGSAPIPYNISAPGNTVPAWLHSDQTLVGGISSVTGVGNVLASTDVIVSSSPYGPATWEDIQSVFPSYPYTMPLAYQDYPYQTSPGAMGLLKPDVSAPGNGTVTTSDGGGYSSFSGTSGATPHVCGTAALLLSANPLLNPEDVAMILQTTAVEKGTPGKDNRYGAGRIDAYEAYLLALSMIPVELVSFTASAGENFVTLNWATATEINNSGFSVERKSTLDGRWVEIGFVPGFGTTSENKSYTFKDESLRKDVYSYRLKQVDFDGTFEYSNSVDVEILTPNNYNLAQNYPNPFNPSTIIEYTIREKSMVRLSIYSVLGELTATIVNQNLEAGFYSAEFDAAEFPSGTYLYQLTVTNDKNSFISTKKMVLIK